MVSEEQPTCERFIGTHRRHHNYEDKVGLSRDVVALLHFWNRGEFPLGGIYQFRRLADDLHLNENGDGVADAARIDDRHVGLNDACFLHSPYAALNGWCGEVNRLPDDPLRNGVVALEDTQNR